jgi:hypothetical protein
VRHVHEQAVDDLDRLLGIIHGDMDVEPEDQLAPRDVLHLVDEVPVPVPGGDALALEEAERVRPGRAVAQALLARDRSDVRPQVAERAVDVRRRPAHGRRDLEHRLHQLGIDGSLVLVAVDRREHGVDVLHEIERLRVEEHVLLLDAERVRIARPEPVVEHRAAAREAAALAGQRGGEDLRHVAGSIASASISTNQRGSSSRVTTHVAAGRISPKTSPWARATPSQWAASVTNMRVRTTSSGRAPASASAATMMSRQRLACA